MYFSVYFTHQLTDFWTVLYNVHYIIISCCLDGKTENYNEPHLLNTHNICFNLKYRTVKWSWPISKRRGGLSSIHGSSPRCSAFCTKRSASELTTD